MEENVRKILVSLVLVLAFAAQACAADKFLLFVNSGDQEIKTIHLAPAGTEAWGPNLMKQWKLKPGKKIRIAVPHDQGDCRWDLKYVVVNKFFYIIKNIDICKAREIQVFLKKTDSWANVK